MNMQKVILKKDEEQRIQNGHPWIFSNEVFSIEGKIQSGKLCDVYTYTGTFLGRGFLNTASKIMVRMLSFEKIEITEEFFVERINLANDFRKQMGLSNNYRVVFSEADGLPGLIVDKYGEYLSVQFLSLGMDMHKQMIVHALVKIFSPKGIMERSDSAVRKKEGLEEYKGMIYHAPFQPKVVIEENGVRLMVDLENGQKTGYFLDQKSNRYLLRKIAHGKRVVDCFSHTGGFALNAAMGNASHVVSVDVSKTALDQGYQNAKLNHLEEKIDFVQADVFDYLDELKENEFDIIVLDPPAFTKSRRTVQKAYNGYKRINKQAMKVLKNGGYLITCSCSRFMETANFEKMLREAASEAGVVLKQVSVTQQNADHPILWTMEETSYLKFYIFQII